MVEESSYIILVEVLYSFPAVLVAEQGFIQRRGKPWDIPPPPPIRAVFPTKKFWQQHGLYIYNSGHI